ncbi:phosphatase PAP2-related protein [Archangium sp.]|uniref:phosphatase PAP2-related protein n=1 Tax=Archangium sp. TaxID=1872627 RepID=UPI00389A55E8
MALRVVLALCFRGTCYAVMLWLALLAEARPAPHLPDLVLEHVPYVPWVDRWNYALWTLAYLPVALLLLREDVSRFCRYTVASGVLALVRGLCILATGLGPVNGADVNAGMDAASRARAFLQLVSPVDVLGANTPHTYLTKDLFFSGHTSTTFLLLLYVWRYQGLRAVMLVGHVLVVASVFFSHLHYTIDVIGAYAITFTVFTLFEGNPRALLAGESPAGVRVTRARAS